MANKIQRETVTRGPGAVTLDGTQMFDQDNITTEVELETADREVTAYGQIDTILVDAVGRVAFRPSGQLTAGILTKLYPYGDPTIGGSIFGATDKTVQVDSIAGKRVLFHAAALTQMPNLKLHAVETAFASQAQISAIVKNNTERVAANSFYTVSDQSFVGSFEVGQVKGGIYTAAWGDPITTGMNIRAEDGWDIEFDLQLESHAADGLGTYDMTIEGLTVRAKCRPIDMAEADVLDALSIQGATMTPIGGSMRSGKDLVITATGALTVTLREAALVEGPMEWGRNELRAGEIGFVAHRKITSNLPGEIFSIALT